MSKQATWSVDPALHRAATRLADELRKAIEALNLSDLKAGDVAEAAELAQQLRRKLEGPRRKRWYDDDAMSLSPSSRSAYLAQSPLRGQWNPIAPPLAIERSTRPDGTPIVVGRARLGAAYEGPPHGVHGGFVAALFDEVLGNVMGLAEALCVTGRLQVRYREVTPLDEELRFEGWIHQERGRQLVARADCHAGSTLTAHAEGLFVRVDFNEIQERMRGRRDAGEPS